MKNVKYVMVYGTLMRGQRANVFLSTSKFMGKAKVDGYDLYDTRYGYPCITKGNGTVVGEVYEFNQFDGTLSNLDCYEGYDVNKKERNLYNRDIVKAKDSKGNVYECYIYSWNGDVDNFIKLPSGKRWGK